MYRLFLKESGCYGISNEVKAISQTGDRSFGRRRTGRALHVLCAAGCRLPRLHQPAHARYSIFPNDHHGRTAAAGRF